MELTSTAVVLLGSREDGGPTCDSILPAVSCAKLIMCKVLRAEEKALLLLYRTVHSFYSSISMC